MAIFSKEMEREFIILIDKRLKYMEILNTLSTHRDVYLGIEKTMKKLNSEIEDCHDEVKDFENELDELKTNAKEAVKGEDIKDLVGQTMLALMPNFNKRISKEVRKHLVAIAEYVIKTFKEKE